MIIRAQETISYDIRNQYHIVYESLYNELGTKESLLNVIVMKNEYFWPILPKIIKNASIWTIAQQMTGAYSLLYLLSYSIFANIQLMDRISFISPA